MSAISLYDMPGSTGSGIHSLEWYSKSQISWDANRMGTGSVIRNSCQKTARFCMVVECL